MAIIVLQNDYYVENCLPTGIFAIPEKEWSQVNWKKYPIVSEEQLFSIKNVSLVGDCSVFVTAKEIFDSLKILFIIPSYDIIRIFDSFFNAAIWYGTGPSSGLLNIWKSHVKTVEENINFISPLFIE